MDANNTTTAISTLRTALEVQGPRDRIDDVTAKLVDDVIQCYIQPAISVFGIIGNLLSFIILFADRKRHNSNLILLALAVSDTLFLVIKNYRVIPCSVRPFDQLRARNIIIAMTPHVTFVPVVLSRMTGMVTALIAVDRFIALTWPFQYKSWMSGNRVLALLFVSVIVPAFFHIPLFMRNTVVMRYSSRAGQELPYVGLTKVYLENKEFFDVWKNLVLNIGFYIIPLVVVIITSIINIYHLRQMRDSGLRKETSVGNASQRERKASVTLTCISVIYAICSLPSFAFLLVRYIEPEYDYHGSMKNSFSVTTKLAGILVVINSSVNFIIYCLVGQAFRDQFLELIRCSNAKKRPTKYQENTTSSDKKEGKNTETSNLK